MPYFPGQWFAAQDDTDRKGLFHACMLALLMPWRDLADLKGLMESFEEAFDWFWIDAPGDIQRIVRNIEFYHECLKSAQDCRDLDLAGDKAHRAGASDVSAQAADFTNL